MSESVWKRIEESRARHNVLENPFYVRWSAGELSADELARYSGQYRHATEALAKLCADTAELAPEPLPPALGRGDAGTDPLLDQLALELGNAGQDGGHHPPVRGRQIERQAAHRDHRHPPALQLLQRVQEVERAAAPAREPSTGLWTSPTWTR